MKRKQVWRRVGAASSVAPVHTTATSLPATSCSQDKVSVKRLASFSELSQTMPRRSRRRLPLRRKKVWRRAGASAAAAHCSDPLLAEDSSTFEHSTVLEVKMDDATIGSGDADEKDDSSKRSGETVAFRKYVDSHVHLDMIALKLMRKERKLQLHAMAKAKSRKPVHVSDDSVVSDKQKVRRALKLLPDFIKTHFGSVEEGFKFDFNGCVTVSCDLWQVRNICWILDQPFAKEYGIVGAFGIHPHNAKDWTPAVAKELGERLDKYRVTGQCVAVGECGLDYYVKKGRSTLLSNRASQCFAFRQQCKIARRKRMPLVVHSRAADAGTRHWDVAEDTLSILCDEFRSKEVRNRQRIHVHCFNNSQWFAQQMMATFPKAFFGFTGVITYVEELCKVAATIPLDRVLLETDGPYMAPVPYRYELAHCGHIPVIAAKLAEIHGVAIDTVLRQCRENARVMYGI